MACDRGADPQVSAWGLQIDPIVPDGADPFLSDSELTLRLIQEDGVEDVPLGASADATWSAEDLPALSATRVGLLITDPNAGLDPLDYADVRAYGQSGPLDVADGQRSIPVLVAPFGQLGGLGELPATRRSIGAAVAVLPDGDVLLFGGTDSVLGAGVTSPGWRHVLRLSRSDEDLVFEEVGDMPSLPNSDPERVGASATVVDTPDGPQVLVAGGRYKFTPTNKSSEQAFLWDPVANEVTWDESMGSGRGRSQHAAIKVANGDVLLAGGWSATGLATTFTFDWYRASTQEFQLGADVDGVGPVGFAWADMGDGGVLVCGGGASAAGNASLLVPTDACQRIGVDGVPRSVADLGTSATHPASALRMWASAATLSDGRVLLCGGTGESIPSGETRPAVGDAFLYDPDTREWEAVDTLQHPRAMHRVVALPDGRAIVLGGVDAAFGVAPTSGGGSVAEVEVFDPVSLAFTDLGVGPVDLGALPTVAQAPGQGLIVVAGVIGEGGGAGYGIVGRGP